MNIYEDYYCPRCMKNLTTTECEICQYCGFYFEQEQTPQALEQGALLQNRRYELGAIIYQQQSHICYAAWDYYRNVPVKIKEYFPQRIAKRNIKEHDTVLFDAENTELYYFGIRKFQEETNGSYFKQHNTMYCVHDFDENE